jgi:hypothetical protein
MFRTLDMGCGNALMRGVSGGLVKMWTLGSVQIVLTEAEHEADSERTIIWHDAC